jgi:hypothetical protein
VTNQFRVAGIECGAIRKDQLFSEDFPYARSPVDFQQTLVRFGTPLTPVRQSSCQMPEVRLWSCFDLWRYARSTMRLPLCPAIPRHEY